MNMQQAEAEIRKFFKDIWGTTTPIAWPDADFTIPEGKNWVRFTCQENDGRQVSMGSPGNNRFRQYGLIILQIFQPQGQGSVAARTLASNASSAFRGAQTTNGVHFENVYSRAVGNDGAGFYQINVFISFYYDELT